MKIALIGYGKMGHIIEEMAQERGHQVICTIDKDNLRDFDSETFVAADVAIEFTTPATAEENIRFPCHVPVAVGFFQGGQQREHAVLLEYPGIGAVIQVSEFCRKTVIQVIESVP